MKKGFLLAVVAMVCLSGFCQTTIEKSIVVQRVDSIQQMQIMNIENKLTLFSKQNKTAIGFMFIGSGLYGIGGLLPETNQKEFPLMTILGVGSGLLGAFLFINSYKHLNFKKKKKIQSEYYENAF
jgi:hypothetical protein